MSNSDHIPARKGEEGFMLLGAVVLIFLLLLTLSIAAAKVSRELRREREVEAIHRGNEYIRAIQLYYRKFGHYPGNMEQLEKSNNIRFLRQKYVDPMTGKADWRLIHQGEAKTTVKGFFGQPLAGLPGGSGGLGSASSMVSPGQGTSTVSGGTNSFGTSSLGGSNSGSSGTSSNVFSLGGSSSSSSGTGSLNGTSTVSSNSSTSSGVSSQSATGSSIGGGGAIVGIGSSKTGQSIAVLNEQTTYETWEFLYDPRIEQLKQQAALMNGVTSTGTNGFGSSNPTTSPTNSNSPFGNSNSNSVFGSSGSSTSTTPTTTTPQ